MKLTTARVVFWHAASVGIAVACCIQHARVWCDYFRAHSMLEALSPSFLYKQMIVLVVLAACVGVYSGALARKAKSYRLLPYLVASGVLGLLVPFCFVLMPMLALSTVAADEAVSFFTFTQNLSGLSLAVLVFWAVKLFVACVIRPATRKDKESGNVKGDCDKQPASIDEVSG